MQKSIVVNVEPKDIGLDQVAIQEGPFTMSFNFELENLIRSVEINGIINTPLLLDKGGDKLIIISGFRRLKAVESLGVNRVKCRVLSANDITSLECLLLNLFENIATRRFNEVEKAMVINRLSVYLDKDELKNSYLPLLKISPSERNLQLYRKIDSDLEDKIGNYLAMGKTSVRVVKELLEIDSKTRIHLFEIMSGYGLNNNQQSNFIDLAKDLASINGLSLRDVASQVVDEGFEHEPRNLPQRANELMKRLRSLRYPILTKAEKRFSRQIKGLNLPQKVRIEPSVFFEEPYYRLEIIFRNGKELNDKLEVIYKTAGIEDLGDLWAEK